MKGKPVKLSRDIDSLNRPVERTPAKAKTVRRVVKPKKPSKRKRDYDDIIDELWL